MSWYNTGFDGISKEEKRQENKYGPPRLYLKADTSREVVFVDSTPMCVYEHNPNIAGTYQNWFTCVQGIHDDVVCCQKLGPDSRYYCGYLTIVDTSLWEDARGVRHQYGLKLVQGKFQTLKRWKRKADDRSFAGCLYKTTRDTDKSASCGDEWEFRREVDMAKLFEVANYKGKLLSDMYTEAEKDSGYMSKLMSTFNVKPDENGKLPRGVIPAFNYYEVLKPMEPAELRAKLGMVNMAEQRSGGGGKGGRGRADAASFRDDDVPF